MNGNKIKIWIPALLGMVWLISSCSGKTRKGKEDPPPIPVTVYTSTRENVSFYDEYPGTVTALKEVGLRGQVTGYITGIYFREGSKVREGQKLYEIDRRQYEASYRESAAGLEIAQENLAKIQRDVDRYTALSNQDAIARQRYDYAITDLANAKSQVALATEELEKAKNNLEYSLITAPFDGTIGISQVKVGDLINPGQTLLNTISSDDPMGIDFVIEQSELSRFELFEKAKQMPGDSTFRLVMPDESIYPFQGTITLIDRAVDPQTGTIRVRLTFPNPGHDLRPGMDCNVMVMHYSKSPEIVIPYKGVTEQMGEYFVFLVKNNQVKQVRIDLGHRVGAGVVVRNGLATGDMIVVDGIGKLRDGAEITTGPPAVQRNNPQKH
jgi:membrane fusion protein, multidrug efflux system